MIKTVNNFTYGTSTTISHTLLYDSSSSRRDKDWPLSISPQMAIQHYDQNSSAQYTSPFSISSYTITLNQNKVNEGLVQKRCQVDSCFCRKMRQVYFAIFYPSTGNLEDLAQLLSVTYNKLGFIDKIVQEGMSLLE